MRGLGNKTPLSAVVEDLVFAAIDIEPLSQPRTATLLNMSGRRLQRFLADEGTSFRFIARHCAFAHAAAELEAGKSVTEVALSLGYDYTQNFTTAFTAKFGVSPSNYQREMKFGNSRSGVPKS